MNIEILESRIAPASLGFTNQDRTVTWTDVDGDLVTLTITKGSLDLSNFETVERNGGLEVHTLNLAFDEFKGASVSISAKQVIAANDTLGNGRVDLGYLNATGIALNSVSISGDLGRIDVGPATPTALNFSALKSLKVASLGFRSDLLSVASTSEVSGKIGSVSIAGPLVGSLNLTGDVFGSIDRLTVGSIIGGDLADSGRVAVSGSIKSITVKGALQGGQGQHSGSIEAGGNIGNVLIGSIVGGRSDTPSTDGTGVLRADGNIGAVTVSGSIFGGTQQESGLIMAGAKLGAVIVNGGVFGGSAGTKNGGIEADSLASLVIKGDLRGGAAVTSGFVKVNSVGAISVHSVIGGEGTDSGLITVFTSSGALTLSGDLIGSSGLNSGGIDVGAKAGVVILKGTLSGGLGANSGVLHLAAGSPSLTVGDVKGGGANSGLIKAEASIANLSIKNLFGGDASDSGSLRLAVVGNLSVRGDIVGGSISSAALADVSGSGAIFANRIANLLVSGSIRTGSDYSPTFHLVDNAAVRVTNDIPVLTVKGGLVGSAETRVLITARGEKSPVINSRNDFAIGTASFGSVLNADILAGYDTSTDLAVAAVNMNAQINSVKVAGDWEASSIVAGVAYRKNFGDGTDVKIAGIDDPYIDSVISSVFIGGSIRGTVDAGDSFGFVAQRIDSFVVGAAKVLLNLGASNDNTASLRYNFSNTLDVKVYEIARFNN